MNAFSFIKLSLKLGNKELINVMKMLMSFTRDGTKKKVKMTSTRE